jgi:hypothetical protein
LHAQMREFMRLHEQPRQIVSDDALAALPVTTVTEAGPLSKECCAVCQDEFAVGTDVKLLPCFHNFHPDCIDPWVRENDSCPTCRACVSKLIAQALRGQFDPEQEEAEEEEDEDDEYDSDAYGDDE